MARDALLPRAGLVAENAPLRQQLLVLRRQVARPRLTRRDRWWMVAAARVIGAGVSTCAPQQWPAPSRTR